MSDLAESLSALEEAVRAIPIIRVEWIYIIAIVSIIASIAAVVAIYRKTPKTTISLFCTIKSSAHYFFKSWFSWTYDKAIFTRILIIHSVSKTISFLVRL